MWTKIKKGVEMLQSIRRGKRKYIHVVVCSMSIHENEITVNAFLEGIRDLSLRCDIRRSLMSAETKFKRLSSLVLVRNKNTCFFIQPVGCTAKKMVDFFFDGGETGIRTRKETFILTKMAA